MTKEAYNKQTSDNRKRIEAANKAASDKRIVAAALPALLAKFNDNRIR